MAEQRQPLSFEFGYDSKNPRKWSIKLNGVELSQNIVGFTLSDSVYDRQNLTIKFVNVDVKGDLNLDPKNVGFVIKEPYTK